jgi:hypothetical protein
MRQAYREVRVPSKNVAHFIEREHLDSAIHHAILVPMAPLGTDRLKALADGVAIGVQDGLASLNAQQDHRLRHALPHRVLNARLALPMVVTLRNRIDVQGTRGFLPMTRRVVVETVMAEPRDLPLLRLPRHEQHEGLRLKKMMTRSQN